MIETFQNETPETSDVVLCKHCGMTLHAPEDDVFWEDNQDHICPKKPRPMIDVLIMTMKMSGNREEHYVRITCDDRSIEIRKYGQDYYNRALYERDMLRHVLLNEPKPNLMDSKYANKKELRE